VSLLSKAISWGDDPSSSGEKTMRSAVCFGKRNLKIQAVFLRWKMKRISKLWEKLIEKDNFYLAWRLTRKGRTRRWDIRKFEKNLDENLEKLRQKVISGNFKTSEYKNKIVNENSKRRLIYILPLPDRIVQHALINVIEDVFTKRFIDHTYGCIRGRGQMKGSEYVRKHIKKYEWCLKTDIKKFYPTMDQQILYDEICKVIKDKKILAMLKDIVFSIEGGKNCPIGNLCSQLFGNIYLNKFDKYVKHELKVKHYCRYCDDCVFFGNSKEELFEIQKKVESFIRTELQQDLSYSEVFRTKQGIDFLGYRHFQGYTILRKRTATKFKRAMNRIKSGKDKRTLLEKLSTINSYKGYAEHCYTYNLIRKLDMNKTIANLTITEFKKIGAIPDLPITGKKVSILNLFGKSLIILAWKEISVDNRPTAKIQFTLEDDEEGKILVVFTSSSTIRKQLSDIDKSNFPIKAVLKKQGEAYYLE
jgi:hypothetical protein